MHGKEMMALARLCIWADWPELFLLVHANHNKISCAGLNRFSQGSHRLEKYLNLEGFLEKSLKIKSALKSTGKSLKSLEKSLNFTLFCRI